MPVRDSIHPLVKQALIKNGWQITNDPYVISFGERFLFVDLGAIDNRIMQGGFIAAELKGRQIAVEIKEFRGKSAIADLEQAIGQYVLYRMLLDRVDPERELYLAISDVTYDDLFREPIGELVVQDLPLKLIVVDLSRMEIKQWIPSRPIEKF